MVEELLKYKQQVSKQANDDEDAADLNRKLKNFNWYCAQGILEFYLRRCMLIGQLDFMQWQGVQPKYAGEEEFESLKQQFRVNTGQVMTRTFRVKSLIKSGDYLAEERK